MRAAARVIRSPSSADLHRTREPGERGSRAARDIRERAAEGRRPPDPRIRGSQPYRRRPSLPSFHAWMILADAASGLRAMRPRAQIIASSTAHGFVDFIRAWFHRRERSESSHLRATMTEPRYRRAERARLRASATCSSLWSASRARRRAFTAERRSARSAPSSSPARSRSTASRTRSETVLSRPAARARKAAFWSSSGKSAFGSSPCPP